jgi:hypothetical protein
MARPGVGCSSAIRPSRGGHQPDAAGGLPDAHADVVVPFATLGVARLGAGLLQNVVEAQAQRAEAVRKRQASGRQWRVTLRHGEGAQRRRHPD